MLENKNNKNYIFAHYNILIASVVMSRGPKVVMKNDNTRSIDWSRVGNKTKGVKFNSHCLKNTIYWLSVRTDEASILFQ